MNTLPPFSSTDPQLNSLLADLEQLEQLPVEEQLARFQELSAALSQYLEDTPASSAPRPADPAASPNA